MGWTAYYQILRDRALDDSELAALDDFIAETNRPPWDCESFWVSVTRDARADRVLGYGWTKLPMNLEDTDDHERLCDALNALPELLAGVEVRIRDDFQSFGWEDGKVVLGGKRGPEGVSLEDHDTAFKPPSELLPRRVHPLHPELEALLGGKPPTRETLGAALASFAQLPEDHPGREPIGNALAAAPAVELALAGLDQYRELRGSHVWKIVTTTITSLTDVEPIVEAFLEVWRHPHGIYWYGDMDVGRADDFAKFPEVETQMREDLAAAVEGGWSELDHRRAGHAAEMLGRARTPTALAALIEAARKLREGMSSDQRYHTNPGVHVGLVRAALPAVVPTLLLDLGANQSKLFRHHRDELGVLAKLAPARVLPALRRLAAQGEMLWEVIQALQSAGDKDTLRALCEFPIKHERERAAEALRALGEEPPPVDQEPAPGTLLLHPSESVRRDARYALERTRDPACMTSVVAALVLESAIGRLTGGAVGSYGEYLQLLPEDLRHADHRTQLAALQAGVSGLPEQIIFPSVQPILDGKGPELAKQYVPVTLHLESELKGALLREERYVLEALRGGSLEIDIDVTSGPPLAWCTDEDADSAPAAPSTPASGTPTPSTAPSTPASSAPSPAPAPAQVSAAPVAAPQATSNDDVIDELLTAMAKEQVPSAELIRRAQLPRDTTERDRWDRQKAIHSALRELGEAAVALRVLARLPELHDGSGLRELCADVLPVLAKTQPDGGRLLAQVFDDAFEIPWESPGRVDSILASVSWVKEVFDRAVEELAAPDNGALSRRTSAAFELLIEAEGYRDEATAVAVARCRADRGKPSTLIGWRSDAYRVLRKAGDAGVPTALLELAELASVGRASSLVEVLGRSERGLAFFEQVIDLPELCLDAARELCRNAKNDAVRIRYLEHPFWRLRLVAADANPVWDRTKVETYAVWAAIDAAKLPVPEDDRRCARPGDALPSRSWDDLARQHGRPVHLAPPPPPRDGLGAACFEYRKWAVWAVDEQLDPADVVARVFADELDAALVARGHTRMAARWRRWRDKVPELPTDRRRRGAWAKEQGGPLPDVLARVRDEGAAAVAATLPPPHLVLGAELRAELEALERPLAERGDAILRSGV